MQPALLAEWVCDLTAEMNDEMDVRPGFTVPRGASAAVLRCLALGEKSVSEVVQGTGLSQPNVSNHLARLRERGLVTSRREGRQVIYQVASAGLAHLLLAHGEPRPEESATLDEVRERFIEAVLTLKEEEAVRVMDGALGGGVGWKEIYLYVFTPAMERVGALWERGELSIAAEHLITAITTRLLHRLSLTLPISPSPNAPTALVACVEGELHTVGPRMVADFLVAEGWRVWYLNGFLPMDHLLEAVHRHVPDAIVLCISTAEHQEALVRTVERLGRWRGEQPLPLLVAGGRFFSEEREVSGLDLAGLDAEVISAEMTRLVAAVRSVGR